MPVIVFYDVNGNGLEDGNEHAIVPTATVQILDQSAETAAATGLATLRVAAGSWTASIMSLPVYYQAGPAVGVSVPIADGQPVRLPARLPIGENRPNVYMAFGDSITEGEGSEDGSGYRSKLQTRLAEWFAAGKIENQALSGTRSDVGAGRIRRSLSNVQPAYTLILYGTNDWNDSRCRNDFPCFTVDALRSMIRQARRAQSLPILSTIVPVNTGFNERAPASRNAWVKSMNELIVPMAAEEGAVVADNYTAFMAVPDFHTLFADHVHPNDAGYDIMVNQFFGAITQPRPAPSALGPGVPQLLPPPGSFPEFVPADPADVPRAPRWDPQPQDRR